MNDPIVDESAAFVPRSRNGNDLRLIFDHARRREEESRHRLIVKNTAR